jgi:uncharacterized damage-inducible protein DinB
MKQPPFLRGEVPGEALIVSAWLRGLEEVAETAHRWTEGLSPEGFWWTPAPGVNPVGALLRHIGGASVRLHAYALGKDVPEAFRRTVAEDLQATGAAPESVLEEFRTALTLVTDGLRGLDGAALEAVRPVGRAQVPAKAAFILHHLVEHAQHHAGQVILTRKLWDARATVNGPGHAA